MWHWGSLCWRCVTAKPLALCAHHCGLFVPRGLWNFDSPISHLPPCRSDQFWLWMSQVFLPYLYNNGSGQESHSTTLGTARLRQLRLQGGRRAGTVALLSHWEVTVLDG